MWKMKSAIGRAKLLHCAWHRFPISLLEEQECIPVRCVPFAVVADGGGGVCLGGVSARGVYTPLDPKADTTPHREQNS